MREEYFWAICTLVWIFGWALIWLWRKKDREAEAGKRRKMLHLERLAAIEKGVPLPELPPLSEEEPGWITPEIDALRVFWLIRSSLVIGLLAVSTGIGMCLGFYLSPDRGFHSMWTLGLIPLFGGFGLLLFYRIASAWDRPSE